MWIASLEEIAGAREPLYAAAEEIFWETANQTAFPDATARALYLHKYFQYYRETEPRWFLLALDRGSAPHDGSLPAVSGYLCAVPDTRSHQELYAIAEHIPLFRDLYGQYPAHLHINLTASARGRGVGSALIAELENRLVREGVPGLHLVTSSTARNRSFYLRNGFEKTVARGEGPVQALFMGKRLFVDR